MAAYASPTTLLPGQIAYEAGAEVRDALASLGRTEDVRFSPGGDRLAIACYARDEIALVDVDVRRDAGGTSVAIEDVVFVRVPSLSEPHGIDFVADDVLVVANRVGVLEVLRIPPAGKAGRTESIASIRCEHGATGSVAVLSAEGGYDLLAVHNWANAVTRYRLGADGSLGEGDVVARRWLDLPDGISVSSDRRWIALSNHETHDVLVFESADLRPDADPVGVLRGVGFPHGLRFTSDDRLLAVADAGAPYVDVFARAGSTWATAAYPAASLRVMDDETFAAGHDSPREGGPKGLDVDPSGRTLVVTAERAPLAFFNLDDAMSAAGARPAGYVVEYELARLRDLARSRAETAEVRAVLGAVQSTKAWRLTAPLRRLSRLLSRPARG